MIRPKFIFITVETVLAFLCLVLAHQLRFHSLEGFVVLWNEGLIRIAIYLLVVINCAYFSDLYSLRQQPTHVYWLKRISLSILASFLTLSAIYYALPSLQYGRGLLVISLGIFGLTQCGVRLFLQKSLRDTRFASKTLILGVGPLAEKIYENMPKDYNPHSYVGFVECGKERALVPENKIVGNIKDLGNLLHDYRPHRLIVALADRRGALPLREIMHSKLRGVEIFDAASYFEMITGRLLVENIQPSTFIYTNGFRMTPFMRKVKRVFDIVLSSLGLILAAPIILIVALLIKLESSGPVIFRQLRVGEREVEYFVYKFRTMVQDAEKESGAVWAQKNDPRITGLGNVLRKCRLDEIPQLYNVLKGDMSFVGPRPERLAFVEQLKKTIPYYSTRHFIKPGVTGWAQVRYPYGASEEDALEKLRYDLYYMKNYSVFLDFHIIFETVRVVLTGFGGR